MNNEVHLIGESRPLLCFSLQDWRYSMLISG